MFFVRSKTMGLLSRILVFLLVITMFSVTGPLSPEVSDAADEVDEITVSTADTLLDAVGNMEDGSELTVTLDSDIELDDPASPSEEEVTAGLVIGGNRTVTVFFNGHSISSAVLDKVIDVEKDGKFVFGDEGEVVNSSEEGKAFTSTGSVTRVTGLCLRYYGDMEAKDRVDKRSAGKIVRAMKRYTVTLAPAEGGVIKDSSGELAATGGTTEKVYFAKGEKAVFKAVPKDSHYISSIKVNGEARTVKYKGGQKITVSNIQENTKIKVSFAIRKYKITAKKETRPGGNGGTITGTCSVEYGANKTFKMVPKFGYDIKRVYVDGNNVGRKTRYTFKNVKKIHRIKVIFKKVDALKIMIDAGHVGYYNRYVGKFDGGYYYESLMTWQLHKYLKKYLEEYNNIIVATTRTSLWRDMDVYDRGYKAKGCDLFLSLHSNSSPSSSTDYPLVIRQLSADKSEKELASKFSRNIGNTMGCRQEPSVWTRYYRSGGRKVEYYGVLRGARAAGVNGYILEHSFHTNRKMALWLYKKSNLRKMARREAAIIADHYGLHKKDGTATPTTTVTPENKAPYRVKITADTVKVRKKAGSSYKQIGTLKKGGIYTIFRLSSSGNWGKLSCDSSGWIYLKGNTKKVSADTDVTNYKVRKNVSESLNIRKGPGINYSILGRIKSNSTIYVIKSETKNGKWGKLKDRSGWVSLDCVKRVY